MESVLKELSQVIKPSEKEEKPEKKEFKTEAARWTVLAAVEKVLNKQFETEKSIIRLGDRVGVPWPSISTGLPTLDDDVCGTGGIPRGRIIEIFGPESSGKTTLALHICAQEQKNKAIVAYIDAEHALDPSYASNLGVDVDNLLVSQPDSGEQALETAIALVNSGAVSLIIIDSVSALVPRAELEGEMGESHMGLQARLMSQAMRKLRGICALNEVTVIFINQIREKIGVMFGSPETTSGGRALKFYASIRFDTRRDGSEGGKIVKDGVLIGHKMKIKAVKNKMAAPARETKVNLIYGVGFDLNSDIIESAINKGVIEQSGAWLNFEGESYHRGDFTNDILNKVKTKLNEIHTRA